MAFSPDGRTLVSTGPDAVRLWDTAGGEHLRCFQTLDHTGTSTVAWGPDAKSLAAPVEGGIYLWNTTANSPAALLGPAGQVANDPASLAAAINGVLLSWPSFSGRAADGHKAFLWDLAAQRLATVLPVTGVLAGAALSPTGARAVTVASPAGTDAAAATLLWDTQVAGGLDLAAAQQSYWDALAAAAGGRPPQEQLRLLHKAQSLSPELFGATHTIDEEEVTQYANLRALQAQVAALAGGAEPQASDFTAEIRSRRPHWTTWSHAELLAQLRDYIRGWNRDDQAGLAAAFQVFATYDMAAAQDAGVLGALVQVLVPGAAELAQQGSVARAGALIQAALAPYPGLPVDPELAAKALYAQSLAWAGYNLAAQEGDAAGALAKYQAALLQYPALGIDPQREANHGYAQWLLETGRQKAEAGDTEGAVALFNQALALDPALDIEPQTEADGIYAQALVAAADELALQGDTAGAEANYTQALALDPTLDIDPVREANASKVQALLDDAQTAAAARSYAAAAASFQAAARLDPSLLTFPPDYIEALCALGADVIGADNAAALCQGLDVAVGDMAIGASVGGTLAADDAIFWRFDAPGAMTIALDLSAPHDQSSFGADLYGTDGVLLYQDIQYLDTSWRSTAVLPEPGRYVVAVRNWGIDGSYRLSIRSTK